METELSLLSPPATPPLELNKVSQSTSNAAIAKNRKKMKKKIANLKYTTYMTKGIPFYQHKVMLRTHSSGAMK